MKNRGVIYSTIAIVSFALGIYLVARWGFSSNVWDFDVFFGSAKNALHGLSIYTYYGANQLPFWYFPWTSWIFIPLAIFSRQIAFMIFLLGGLITAFLSIHVLAAYFKNFNSLDRLFMFGMLLLMGWLTYRVGQISFFILGVVILVIFLLSKEHSTLAGLLIPLLLIKPHLFILFIPTVLWLGGKKTIVSGALITLLFFGIEFIISPNWVNQMLNLLITGSKALVNDPYYNFTTLPQLLGISQNDVGTADLPITIIQIFISVLVILRFRHLPKVPLLCLALAASLFCAPRSYSYDLVLLIPAMIWLSEEWSYKTVMLWVACAAITIVSKLSTGAYIVTLIVFCLSIHKAFSVEKQNGIAKSFWGKPVITDS